MGKGVQWVRSMYANRWKEPGGGGGWKWVIRGWMGNKKRKTAHGSGEERGRSERGGIVGGEGKRKVEGTGEGTVMEGSETAR